MHLERHLLIDHKEEQLSKTAYYGGVRNSLPQKIFENKLDTILISVMFKDTQDQS